MRFNRYALLSLLAFSSISSQIARAQDDSGDVDVEVSSETPLENAESFPFEAEVSKMMDIVVNSLYQNKDVFLRELISNASDALDKIRFLSIENPELLEDKPEFEVRITYDVEANSVTITDSGIGMTRDDLVSNLGTVARSGTTKFLEAMEESKTGAMNMIGQFGVGFYSSMLVADKVRVVSKSPDDPVQHVWETVNGSSDFQVAADPRGNTLGRGTEITLYLKEDAREYADPKRISDLATHYSEFVTHPILVRTTETNMVEKEKEEVDEVDKDESDEDELNVNEDEDGDADEDEEPEMEEVTSFSWDQVNTNKPIWTKSKEDISDEEYQNFFKVVSKGFGKAAHWTHFNAEGSINFNSILYLPEEIPQRLRAGNFYEKEKGGLKLYVRKVLISDEFELLPNYLSFINGVVDSDDLPLNVNRETLQETKIIKVISKKLVRKCIEMIRKLSQEELPEKEVEEEDKESAAEVDEDGNIIEVEDDDDDADDEVVEHPFVSFYKKFNPSLKMGVIEDEGNRAKIAKLLRYKTSKFDGDDDWVSLDDYISRMPEWQDEIFVFYGSSVDELKNSQFMEKFFAKDAEVIYMIDPVDEYMTNSLPEYDGKKFMLITKEGLKFKDEDADLVKRREKAYKEQFKPLTKFLKKTYGSSVMKVIVSKRLADAPALVSTSEYGQSANMQRIMKAQAFQHGRADHEMYASKVLEINPRHPFVVSLLDSITGEDDDVDADAATITDPKAIDAAWMIHDVAMLNSGFTIDDVKAYSERMTRALQLSLDIDSLDLEEEINPPVEDDEPDEFDMDSMPDGLNMDDFNMDDIDMESINMGE